jgi:Tol biopolymer transport system component
VLPLLALSLGGCQGPFGLNRRPAPASGFGAEAREEPALSGDGRLLASLVERNGRSSVLLQDRFSGKVLPLRTLNGQQPHSSPSLSWTGRYLAVIVQRGERRLAMVEDRATGRPHPLVLPAGEEPQRISLAPDGRRLAVQIVKAGQRRVELFELSDLLEADLLPGQPAQGR